ncbi:glycoside hydrolase family 32 protein [Liquorilactobacillus uvarum]|uniref:Sucrose-6-phosphate hydrolase n=1 Tax=Liquorilactobacillus uvarum DSM 19971 TaxID=1423812 RepID=A0A0R1Q6G0_9LACO|nr:sucrose-6-phosphate hydrolase [Liquorilactobacillus uvarum]KRL36811.1 hypothetical protein FD20_GL001032 [Liquorilactobacillus uvarum DSM 19971]
MNIITNERYRQNYHIMPPRGWMNDPNGLCFFKGYYHVFFQYHPYSAEWGPMHWGHVRSLDLVHWEECPVALTPGNPEDKDGCFSGSAVVKDNKMYLIYTGHHYVEGTRQQKFWQNQNIAVSEDGLHFQKYDGNPIIAKPPDDNSDDFRDPKVWHKKDVWYMVLGSQDKSKQGRVLLYRSKDLFKWDYLKVLTAADPTANEGYMWECPDYFELDGKNLLLVSPQGINAEHGMFKNIHQTGYFILDQDKDSKSAFHELDSGHDFYATQTCMTEDGRRIMFAWMDMWETEMREQSDGWAGTMTIPRELTMHGDRLYAFPIAELKGLRSKLLFTQNKLSKEIIFKSSSHALEINADLGWANSKTSIYFKLSDKVKKQILTIEFNPQERKAYLRRMGEDGERQAPLSLMQQLKLKIYVDSSSIELFINGGESSFSERFYAEGGLNFNFSSENLIRQQLNVYCLKENQ